jgi:hypothetical protein
MLLAFVVALPGWAQSAPYDAPPLVEEENPGTQDMSPPPLPPVDPAPMPTVAAPQPVDTPTAPPPETTPDGLLKPRAIANAPLGPQGPPMVEDEPPGRGVRIATGLLFGAGLGAAGALIGGLIGSAANHPEFASPFGSTWVGAAAGFAVGAPIGVMLSGQLFDGDGSLWATLLGEALGAGVSVLIGLSGGGQESIPLFALLPLAGAVLGYELTSPSSRTQVMPQVSVGPRGTSVGLAGTF